MAVKIGSFVVSFTGSEKQDTCTLYFHKRKDICESILLSPMPYLIFNFPFIGTAISRAVDT